MNSQGFGTGEEIACVGNIVFSTQKMSTPALSGGPKASNQGTSSSTGQPGLHRPTEALENTQSTSTVVPIAQGEQTAPTKKRRNHRGGKHKRSRRKSFAVAEDESASAEVSRSNRDLLDPSTPGPARLPIYRLGQSGGRTLSSTSLDSEALLDHRYVEMITLPKDLL